jgi:hypothetical protein
VTLSGPWHRADTAPSKPLKKKTPSGQAPDGVFLRALQGSLSRNYLAALAGVEGLPAVPASGVGVGLVLPPVEPLLVDGVEGVDGAAPPGVEGVAPVSSTFLPQAPRASNAARARAVAAAGLNLDASMSVSFFRK